MFNFTNMIKSILILLLTHFAYCAVGVSDSSIVNFPKNAPDSIKANYYIKAANNLKGNSPQEAYEFALKALKLTETSNILTSYIDAQNIIGSIKHDLGEFNNALESYIKALEKAELLHDNFRTSQTLNYIGIVYLSINEKQLAISYFKQSLSIAENTKYNNQILNNLYKLGVIYESLDSLNLAYKYYKRSLLIEEEMKNKEGMFYSLMGIGSISTKKENFYQAYIIYNRALQIANETEVLAYQSLCYSKLGDLMREQKEYVKARDFYLKALTIADSLNFNKERKDCYFNLAKTNESLEFYNDAYYYLGRYVDIKDTLFSQEASIRNLRMQIRFDLKNKEKEIELLKQKEQQNNITRNFLIIGFVLILLVAFLLFYLNRIKQHSNKLLKEQNREIEQQKEEIGTNLEQLAATNTELAAKNQQITDSLVYASTIQETILPHANIFKNYFKDSFVFFKPRDIVSGDFYWINYRKGNVFIALADCTGHGVAGAFMSMIGYTLLNSIIEEISDASPALILEKLNIKILETMHQHDSSHDDGMDIAICSYNLKNRILEYSGANQNIAIAQNGELKVYNGDISSIGGTFGKKEEQNFTNYNIEITTEATVYLYSDGFQDQFGGPNNQKYMSEQFLSLLNNISQFPLQQQNDMLNLAFNDWKGTHKHTDDVLVIGLKF